jgi:hypothetical protein
MPTLTVTSVITYGSTVPDGSVPMREPVSMTFTYTEQSIKTVQIAANITDYSVTLDTLDAPKFVFIQAVETDVTVKLSDGTVVTPTPTALAVASGWVMLANPAGQPIKEFLVTTPASPTTGARVKFLAFE